MTTHQFDDAIHYAQQHEVPWPRDPHDAPLRWGVHHADPPPFNRLRGPVHPRGPVSGVIRRHGQELASWGEPERADLTFSVAKTCLALLAGVASARGLLPDVNEPVVNRVPGIGFDNGHNRLVTWAHLLEQTSEWQGTCFGMPDQIEHHRQVTHDPKPSTGRKGDARILNEPGTYWEYNDVRINQLALALLCLFEQPLPDVFREAIMGPLGASDGWQWSGYADAWLDIAGRRMQSVPGGSHWGAGLSISARDLALIGHLLLNDGLQNGVPLVAPGWVRRMQEPCAIAPFYGWLAWLNRDGRLFSDASQDSYFMIGAGGHYVWIDPETNAVVVVRWLDPKFAQGFVARVCQAHQSNWF